MAGVVSKIEFLCNISSSHSISYNNAQCYVPCKSGGFSCSMGYPFAKKLNSLVGRSCSYSSQIYIYGRGLFAGSREGKRSAAAASNAQMSIGIGKAQRWWEKGLQLNMKEITGAQDLVDSLLNAGDKLVIVDLFSPGCGGCKALHPKICQFAEMNPDVQFLQVNYEEHKSMCYSLNIHVLPFFRFYRGADGRLCSFSCTNATIKKLRDALAKHKPDRCSLGPPKGLEEKELIALAANKDLSFNYIPKPDQPVVVPTLQETSAAERSIAPVSHPNPIPLPLPLPSVSSSKAIEDREAKKLAAARR